MNNYPPAQDLTQKAWVVFSGQADRAWLRFLKPGFRHCFVLLHDGRHWLSFDPLLNHSEVLVHYHLSDDFDFPGWLENRGERIVPASLCRTRANPAPVTLFTCVEAVKRVLGLHNWFIFTPWQLYRHLILLHEKKGELSWEV